MYEIKWKRKKWASNWIRAQARPQIGPINSSAWEIWPSPSRIFSIVRHFRRMIKVTSEIIISSITTLKIHLWVTFWWSSLKWQRSHSRTDYGLSLKRGRVSFTPSQVPLLASIPWRIFSYKHRLPIHFFKLNHIVITIRLDQINFGLSYVGVAWLSSSVPPDFFSSPRTDFSVKAGGPLIRVRRVERVRRVGRVRRVRRARRVRLLKKSQVSVTHVWAVNCQGMPDSRN